MKRMIFIFITFFSLQNNNFAQTPCSEKPLYNEAILNNILNLTPEQIELKSLNCKAFKKNLTKDQRIKYNMIKKLEKDEYKKSKKPKHYYVSNPQMTYFGDPRTCPNFKK
jgi:hypothetical protein